MRIHGSLRAFVGAAFILGCVLFGPACSRDQPTSPLVARLPGGAVNDTTHTPPPPPVPEQPLVTSITVSDSSATPGQAITLDITVTNPKAAATTVSYSIGSREGWAGFPIAGMLDVPGSGSVHAAHAITVPVDAPHGYNTLVGDFSAPVAPGNWYPEVYIFVQ